MEFSAWLLIFFAGFGAGMANALAGGGTLISFPALLAVGLGAVPANVTSTVALLPGYAGAIWAQRKDLIGQQKRLWMFLPAALLGGYGGAWLLLEVGERVFAKQVPYIILAACLLLALQERVKVWVVAPNHASHVLGRILLPSLILVFLASMYGGYFGAGASVIVLALLGMSLHDSLTRLNALKAAIGFCMTIAATSVFIFNAPVVWPAAGATALGALAGGFAGGRIAGAVRPAVLRWIVISLGTLVASLMLSKS